MSSGSCAAGFGVCCLVSLSVCGAQLSVNGSYISNPVDNQVIHTIAMHGSATGYDVQDSCIYSLQAATDVCNIRLDFLKFDLSGPTDNTVANLGGRCTTDKLEIIRSRYPPTPVLCGVNTGHHILLDIVTGDTMEIQFVTDLATTFTRAWTVKVSQIPCDSNLGGCYQYYTGVSGTITSFNWYNPDTTRQLHLAGMDYTICVRREEGHCCIR